MRTRLADAGILNRLEKDHQRWIRTRWYLVALVVAYAIIQCRFLLMTAFHRPLPLLAESDSLQIPAAKIAFISGFLLALFVTSLTLQWQHYTKINQLLAIIKRSQSEAQP